MYSWLWLYNTMTLAGGVLPFCWDTIGVFDWATFDFTLLFFIMRDI